MQKNCTTLVGCYFFYVVINYLADGDVDLVRGEAGLRDVVVQVGIHADHLHEPIDLENKRIMHNQKNDCSSNFVNCCEKVLPQ